MRRGANAIALGCVVAAVAIACASCGAFGSATAADDASTQSSLDSGGGATDGGTEGGNNPDGSSAPFCTTRPKAVFCRSFDDIAVPLTGWDEDFINNGGSAAFDNVLSTSAPRSLRFKLPATLDGTGTDARYEKRIPRSSWPGIRFETSVYLRKTTWTTDHRNTAIASVVLNNDVNQPALYAFLVVEEKAFGVGVTIGGTYSGTPQGSEPFPFDTWVHVVLEIDSFNGGVLPVRVSFDGRPVFANAFSGTSTKPITQVVASIGIDNINPPAPAFDVNYDDVALELQ